MASDPAVRVKRSIGIDPSYSGLGISLLEEDGTHITTVKRFSPDLLGQGPRRLDTIADYVFDVIFGFGTDQTQIVLEGYASDSKFGREISGELCGAIKTVLYREFNAYPTIVAPTALKKFTIGKASSGKELMLLHVFKKYGVEFSDNNAADAYALAQIGLHLPYDPEEPLHKYEHEVLKALTHETERFPR